MLLPVVLYVRRGCPFSPLACGRACAVVGEFPRLRLFIREHVDADRFGDRVPVTPTLLLPNGTRLTGTPSEERLRRVLASLLEKQSVVPNKVWYLERNRLFRGVPLAEIEKMAHLFHEQDYKAKEVIFAEGDLGDAIYLLKTGHVRLYRITEDGKEISLAILGPGDVFGELALFEEAQRQTFAEALDAAHICASSVDDFTRLMGHKPQFTMMVAREVARRRTDVETRFAGMAYGSVRGRLLQALRRLAEEHGAVQPDGGVRINIRLSHQELANLIGTSREACTIALGTLQKGGLLRLDADRHIVIAQIERLQLGVIDRVVHAFLTG